MVVVVTVVVLIHPCLGVDIDTDRVATFHLEDCSLFVFSGSAFDDYWHGILSRHAPGN